MKPKISVIVPVYNTQRYLERCIYYLINQSEKNLEIILVDDCSTDGSKTIIEKAKALHPRQIKSFFNPKNIGVGATRNIGMDMATGEFLSFIDSDDWLDSSAYSKALDALYAENADIAILGIKDERECYSDSKIRYSYNYNTFSNDFAIRLLSRSESNDAFISPMVTHKIYRKEFLDTHNLRFRADTFFEDDEFTFKCLLYNCKIVTLPNTYYHYFQRPNSIMHRFSKVYIDGFIGLFGNLKKFLQESFLWNQYNGVFYKFFHKSFYSFLNALFTNEPEVSMQKKYFAYFFTKIQTMDAEDFIEYIDLDAIKRLL